MEARKIAAVAKPLPPKLGGQPKPPTGATREPALSAPSKPAAQPPPDPKVQKKKLKDLDWSQKGYFDGDGIQGSEKVSTPAEPAPRRGRTLVIPAVREEPQPEPEPEGRWAQAEAPSSQEVRQDFRELMRDLRDTREAKEAREGREAQQPKQGEAKGAAQKRSLGSSPMQRTQKASVQPPPLPGEAKPKGTLYEMLENAKEPGVLFEEDDQGGGAGGEGEEEDPELMEAVEECIRLLFGVRGIHHISPGTNDQGEKVVVVAAGPGFNEESMRRVPERVGKFKTLVALPFDLLPLKRAAPR